MQTRIHDRILFYPAPTAAAHGCAGTSLSAGTTGAAAHARITLLLGLIVPVLIAE